MYGLALRYSSLSFAGFQFDYVFDWVLRSQQTQIATPFQPLGPCAGPSSDIPPAIPDAERHSGEEGRQSADPF